MKFRTSFFNSKALLKDITRFAPAWGLYTVCLFMGFVLLFEGNSHAFTTNLAVCTGIMPVVNLFYGLLTAQLLFGDIYNSRMCNALHALPLRREGWFAVHFTAGLFFSLVPTAVMAGLSVPILLTTPMEKGALIALWWFLGTNAQYLFFFGSALLAIFCCGNRLAAGVVYGIIQLGAMLVYFLISTIYTPMLYGVECQVAEFRRFCPVVNMMSNEYVDYMWVRNAYQEIISGSYTLTGNWGYLWLCAGLGVVCALLGLVLYRFRKLERAGDFIAVSWLKPVFLVLYCLTAATMFQFAQSIYGVTSGMPPVLLFIGLAVGWFTGSMLLERSTRVFGLRKWIGLAVLLVVVGGSLVLTWQDPMGIACRVPEMSQIQSVTIHEGYDGGRSIELTEARDISDARLLHQLAMEERDAESGGFLGPDGVVVEWPDADNIDAYARPAFFHITYRLENGASVHRRYVIWSSTQAGNLLRGLTSRPEYIFVDDALPDPDGSIGRFQISGYPLPPELWNKAVLQELVDAIEADCAAGVLAPEYYFHPRYIDQEQDEYNFWVYLEVDDHRYSFSIFGDSEACLAWVDRYELRQLMVDEADTEKIW